MLLYLVSIKNLISTSLCVLLWLIFLTSHCIKSESLKRSSHTGSELNHGSVWSSLWLIGLDWSETSKSQNKCVRSGNPLKQHNIFWGASFQTWMPCSSKNHLEQQLVAYRANAAPVLNQCSLGVDFLIYQYIVRFTINLLVLLWVRIQAGAFLCGVCMFSSCLRGWF